MKHYFSIALMFFLTMFLISCAYNQYPYLNSDFTKETWQREIDRNPSHWARGADRWFLTGDPNATEIANKNAPDSAAISTMMVRVTDFTKITANGNFQVQIFGARDHNSVFVFGPNEDVRETIVTVNNGQLYLGQSDRAKSSMKRVIIRIGVKNLTQLVQMGCGTIEGIQLYSHHLTVSSSGSGNVYLAGDVNLTRAAVRGDGSVSVFGTRSPKLDIITTGKGSFNVSGQVGVQSILHHGKGDINIIGANSNSLEIYADGSGKIGIGGRVNLQELRANDSVCVFIDCIDSKKTHVFVSNKSRVGLSGRVRDLYVYTDGSAKFYGRYLCAENAYVRASDSSHINVMATNKIFASATGNGTVYFFGDPRILTQFVSGNGTIIPIWSGLENSTENFYNETAGKDQPVKYKAARTRSRSYASNYIK